MILICEGYVAKQPQLVVVSDTAVKCEFTVLEKRNVKEHGAWVQVTEAATFVAWNDEARTLAEVLVPGRELQVVGRQETSRWTDGAGQKQSRVLYRLTDYTLRPKRQSQDSSEPANPRAQAPREQSRAQRPQAPTGERGAPAAAPRPSYAQRPGQQQPQPERHPPETDDDGFYRFN